MRRAGPGAIVNISSISALRPSGTNLAYSCSKAAVDHLTRGLAVALGPVIRVNGILPGRVLTRRAPAGDGAFLGVLERQVEDIATVALECLRNESLTAVTIPVDAS